MTTPSNFVEGIECKIGETTNSLQFYFKDFKRPDLVQLDFDFTNFRNPWSAASLKSIRIDSYRSKNCSGEAESSVQVENQSFSATIASENNYKVLSATNDLGNSNPNNKVTF